MILQRSTSDSYATFGALFDEAGMQECVSLELPWAENVPDQSCIPAGTYTCSLRFSPHHGFAVFGVEGVPGRTNVEIHAANVPAQLLGCIALGQSVGLLNGVRAVLASQAAVEAFMIARHCEDYRKLTDEQATAYWKTVWPQYATFSLTVADPPTPA